MSAPLRYALAGTGHRGLGMFARPLLSEFPATAVLAALYDPNPLRLQAARSLLEAPDLPIFTDFEAMLREADPDGVVIATPDRTHAGLFLRTLDAGKRAICEKPLCTTAGDCRAILDAAARQGARGLVTHNYRYRPAMLQVKSLVREGAIGRLLAMSVEENLDRRHGADYFRRWHRFKENSGGLLIHKACHHFDLLNWVAGSRPATVSALGGLSFYGKKGPFRHGRCRGCPHADRCAFHIDLAASERLRRLFIEAEGADGYFRDGCVFDERIDIEDHAVVAIAYEDGVRAGFTLTAFAAYEGVRFVFEGTQGRLEWTAGFDTSWAVGSGRTPEELVGERLVLHARGERPREVEVPRVKGGHGGADVRLRADFFGRPPDRPPTEEMASVEEAVQAVLIGAAANQSLAEGGGAVQAQRLLDKTS